MKKILPILFSTLLLLLGFYSNAQQYNIIKTQAFFRKTTAGNVSVDDNGNPTTKGVSKDYLIYIETKGTTLPQWKTAYIDGLPYTLRAVEVKQPAINLGSLKGQKTIVTVKKGLGNRLWQMVLSPQQKNDALSVSNTPAIPISLIGTYKGKSFTYKITKLQELAKQFNP